MLHLPNTVKGVMTVIGGVLIHLSLGTLYTFGNMNPYVSSYLRLYSQSTDILQTQTVWIFTLSTFGQGSFMVLGGLMERRIGPQLTVLIGGWIMSAGVLLTAATIKVNIYATVVTYGLMFGAGTGIAYAVAISAAMSWFPNHAGVVGGFVVAGFGGGALIFNQIQTHFVNPSNVVPNVTIAGEHFFDDEDVLLRVPQCFILIGSIYAGMQLLGALLIRKRSTEDDETPLMKSNDETTPIAGDSSEFVREPQKEAREEEEHHTVDDEVNYTPKQMLRTRNFWVLWFTFMLNSQSIVFISTLYKTFGQTFIADDIFLATIGSVSAVFNALCRILWGKCHDHFNYKYPMLALCFLLAVMLGTFPLTYYMGRAGFTIWVCLLFAIFSGNFALFPAATSSTFGMKYMAINYGLVFTANAIAGIISATLTTILSQKIGLNGVFFLGGGESFVAFLITFLFQPRSQLYFSFGRSFGR